MGDPRLRQVAEPVDAFDTPELHELIEDMFDTMEAADGAGLAATQIGVMKRIMIFGVESTPRRCQKVSLRKKLMLFFRVAV